MTRPSPVFYILHGDDTYTIKHEVRSMRARMDETGAGDLNTSMYDGRLASASDVISAASMMPFMADRRLVIVEGMLTWLNRKGGGKAAKAELEALIAGMPALPDSARLVFVELEPLKNDHPLIKLALQEGMRGYVKDFSPPRDPMDRYGGRWDPAWISKWIVRRVEHYGGSIDLRAAAALAAVTDQDLYRADSECFKLVSYVGGERAITEADIADMTPYVPETRIFDIVDALGMGKASQASTLIHRLLADPKESPLALLSMITRQFRLLILVREALDLNRNPRELPELQRLPIQKLVEQARRFSLEQLEAIYHNLLDTDHAIKTGRVEDTLALDLFVAGLTG